MSAGASYTPANDSIDAESNLVCYIPAAGPGAGVPTQIKYVELFNPDGSFNAVQYQSLTGTVLALTPAELATVSFGKCGARARTATFKIGGPGAPVGTFPDGTVLDLGAWLSQPAIQALVGGVAALEGWEIVVLSGANPAIAGSANRIEITEQSNGNGTNAVRVLSQGESVRGADEDGLDNVLFAGFGTARALIQISYRKAGV